MAEEIRKRDEIEDRYKWDLTHIFPSDGAWEEAYGAAMAAAQAVAALDGKTAEDPKKAIRDVQGLFDRILPGGRINEILPETDILVASLPATPETFHLVAEEQLKCLPDDAVVINVGRGSVIDQAALGKELRSGRLYAGLDVFETEPVPPGSTLWTCPHLLITPHVAGDTTLPHTLDRIVDLFIADLDRYCAGRPLAGLVDRRIGY